VPTALSFWRYQRLTRGLRLDEVARLTRAEGLPLSISVLCQLELGRIEMKPAQARVLTRVYKRIPEAAPAPPPLAAR
jgi:hypothetical protein